MPVNNSELLIDHLDKKMQGESLPEAEALLQNDSNAREEWQYLQAAVDAVEHLALHAKVAAVRDALTNDATTPANEPARTMTAKKPVVRSITSRIYRIAAAIVLLVGSLAVYKFVTVNNTDFYNRHYTAYQLPTSRGSEEITIIEQAFRNGDWMTVNTAYNSLTAKSNKDHFLAGMASLELKEFPQAVTRFVIVQNNNAASKDTYFQDEAEFYLALAYIADDQVDQAAKLLDKIKADKNHLYHEKATKMSGTDFKILELK